MCITFNTQFVYMRHRHCDVVRAVRTQLIPTNSMPANISKPMALHIFYIKIGNNMHGMASLHVPHLRIVLWMA